MHSPWVDPSHLVVPPSTKPCGSIKTSTARSRGFRRYDYTLTGVDIREHITGEVAGTEPFDCPKYVPWFWWCPAPG